MEVRADSGLYDRKIVAWLEDKWSHPSRFIAIRRLRPEELSEQLTLFSTGRYSYQL